MVVQQPTYLVLYSRFVLFELAYLVVHEQRGTAYFKIGDILAQIEEFTTSHAVQRYQTLVVNFRDESLPQLLLFVQIFTSLLLLSFQ